METQSEHEYKWSIEGIETIKFDSFNKLLFRFINKYQESIDIDDHVQLLEQIYSRVTIRKVIKASDGQTIICYPKIKVKIQNDQSNEDHEIPQGHRESQSVDREPCNNQEKENDSQQKSDTIKLINQNRKIQQQVDLDENRTFQAFVEKEEIIYEEHVVYYLNNEDYQPKCDDIVTHILADLNDVMPLGYPTDQYQIFFKNNSNNTLNQSEKENIYNDIISGDLLGLCDNRIHGIVKVQKQITQSQDKENFCQFNSENKISSFKLQRKIEENSILQEINYQDMQNQKTQKYKQISNSQEIDNKSCSSINQNSQKTSSDILNDFNQNLQFPNDSYFMKELQINKSNALNQGNQKEFSLHRNRISDINQHSKEESFYQNMSDNKYFNSNKSAASFESLISNNKLNDINNETKTEFMIYLKQQVQLEIQKQAKYSQMKDELDQLNINFKITKEYQQTELDKKKLRAWILNDKKNNIQDQQQKEIQLKFEMLNNIEQIKDQIQEKQQINILLQKNIQLQNKEIAKQVYDQKLQTQQKQQEECQMLNILMKNEQKQLLQLQIDQQTIEKQTVSLQNQIQKIQQIDKKYYGQIVDKNKNIHEAKQEIQKINEEIEELIQEEYEIKEIKDMYETQISFLNKQNIIFQRDTENVPQRCKSTFNEKKKMMYFKQNNLKFARNHSQNYKDESFTQFDFDILEIKNKSMRFSGACYSEFENQLQVNHLQNPNSIQGSKFHIKNQSKISGSASNFQQKNFDISKKPHNKNEEQYQNQRQPQNKYLDQLDKSIAQNLLKIKQLKQDNQNNKEIKNRNLKSFLSKQNIADQNKYTNIQPFVKKINTRNQQYEMMKYQQKSKVYESAVIYKESKSIYNIQNNQQEIKKYDCQKQNLPNYLQTQQYKSCTPQTQRQSQSQENQRLMDNNQKCTNNFDFQFKIYSKFGNSFFQSQKNENEKRYKSQQPIKLSFENKFEKTNQKSILQQYESKKDKISEYNQNDQIIASNYYTFADEVKELSTKKSTGSLKKYKNSNIRNTSEFKNFKYSTEDMKYGKTQKFSKSLNKEDEKVSKKESKIPTLKKYILNQVDSSITQQFNQNRITGNYTDRLIYLKEQCIYPLKSQSNNYNSINKKDCNQIFYQDKISQYRVKDQFQQKNEPTILLNNQKMKSPLRLQDQQKQQNPIINEKKYQNKNDQQSQEQILKLSNCQYQSAQYENFPLSKLGVNLVSNFAKRKLLLETNLNEKENQLHSSKSQKIIKNENLISYPQSQFNFSNVSTKEQFPLTSRSESNITETQSIMKIEYKIENEYVEIQKLDLKNLQNYKQVQQQNASNNQISSNDSPYGLPQGKNQNVYQKEEQKNENYSEYKDIETINENFQQNNFDQIKLLEQFKQSNCAPESTPSSIIEKSTQSNKYLAPITERFDDYSTNQIQGREQNSLENIQQELVQLLQQQNHGNYNSLNVNHKQISNFEFLQQQISQITNQQQLICTQQRACKNQDSNCNLKEDEKMEESVDEIQITGSSQWTHEKTMGSENIEINMQTEPQILINKYQSCQDVYEDEENVSDAENENDKTYLSLKDQADIVSMPRSAKGPSYLNQ